MARTVETTVETVVRITINDPDVIERVTGPKGDEWRAQLYNLHTEADVLNHPAHHLDETPTRHLHREVLLLKDEVAGRGARLTEFVDG